MAFENQSIMHSAEPFLFKGGNIGCLLVHGFTGTPKEMRTLGEFLAEKNYTVMGIRLAGHATKPEDIIRTRWQDWLGSVEDGIHLLQQSCSQVFLAGLSMGGMLTTIAASRFPVAGIVLMATLYQMPQDWRLKLIGVMKYVMPFVDKGEDDWNNPDYGIGHQSYPQYPTASVGELAKLMDEMRRSAPKVKKPALIIQSENDGTVPLDHAQIFYDELGSADKEIFLVKNSGHIVTRDTEKDAVFHKIDEFILRVLSS